MTETESLPFVELREQVVPWEKADVAARVPMRDVEGKVLWSEVVRDTLRLQIRLADYEYSHDHLSLIDRRHWREMVSFFRAFADTALRDLDV